MENDDVLAVLDQAASWLDENRRVALATVIDTWGSAPRPVGSQMAISEDGRFEGSVSGGCVEIAVVTEAQAAMQDGKPRLLSFGVADSDAWAIGLACGGTIRIYVEPVVPMKRATLDALREARRTRREVTVRTDLNTGVQTIAEDGGDRSHIDGGEDGETFIHVFTPTPRLIVIGAVHIAQKLVLLARLADFAVSVVDPRTAFATVERFPDVPLSHDWPDPAIAALSPDAATAIVTLSHDPKLDDPALIAALNSPAFYIGALGSWKTHASRLGRLRESGFDDGALSRIHAPVGLPIGAVSPGEIAVSIMAEIVATRRGRLLQAAPA